VLFFLLATHVRLSFAGRAFPSFLCERGFIAAGHLGGWPELIGLDRGKAGWRYCMCEKEMVKTQARLEPSAKSLVVSLPVAISLRSTLCRIDLSCLLVDRKDRQTDRPILRYSMNRWQYLPRYSLEINVSSTSIRTRRDIAANDKPRTRYQALRSPLPAAQSSFARIYEETSREPDTTKEDLQQKKKRNHISIIVSPARTGTIRHPFHEAVS